RLQLRVVGSLLLLVGLLLAGQGRGETHLGVAVEEGEELVILALADRVELVVVALGTADREAEPDLAGRVDAIDNRLAAELLLIDTPLAIGQRVAVKARRDLLIDRGAR